MFVPEPLVDTFIKSTSFGIYGSTLVVGDLEQELSVLLRGLIEMRSEMSHPLFNKDTPIALVTGGGPGLMEVGNRVANRLGILSCANVVDFRNSNNLNIQEQKQNPYIEAKMTYRLDQLVERQAEFHLDFPIILSGGFGTDFEHCLEEVRRKVGSITPTPVLLFGAPSYWKEKITSRYHCNLKAEPSAIPNGSATPSTASAPQSKASKSTASTSPTPSPSGPSSPPPPTGSTPRSVRNCAFERIKAPGFHDRRGGLYFFNTGPRSDREIAGVFTRLKCAIPNGAGCAQN